MISGRTARSICYRQRTVGPNAEATIKTLSKADLDKDGDPVYEWGRLVLYKVLLTLTNGYDPPVYCVVTTFRRDLRMEAGHRLLAREHWLQVTTSQFVVFPSRRIFEPSLLRSCTAPSSGSSPPIYLDRDIYLSLYRSPSAVANTLAAKARSLSS